MSLACPSNRGTLANPGTTGTVDKAGGLDNYLTGTKPARIKELGPMGWKLRWEVMRSRKYLERRAAELKAMGLSAEGAEESVAQQLQAEAGSQEMREKEKEKEEKEAKEKEKEEKEEKEQEKQPQQQQQLEVDSAGKTML